MEPAWTPCGPGCACNSLTLICSGPVDTEPGWLERRATEYAATQYDIRQQNAGVYCVHMGGDGAYHYSGAEHQHITYGAAVACRDARRAACVARILALGGHSEL